MLWMITRKESETAQCISIPSRYLHKAPLTPQKSKSMQILINILENNRKNSKTCLGWLLSSRLVSTNPHKNATLASAKKKLSWTGGKRHTFFCQNFVQLFRLLLGSSLVGEKSPYFGADGLFTKIGREPFSQLWVLNHCPRNFTPSHNNYEICNIPVVSGVGITDWVTV